LQAAFGKLQEEGDAAKNTVEKIRSLLEDAVKS
jgi:hypothetical protein